jgi:hypothetical protein
MLRLTIKGPVEAAIKAAQDHDVKLGSISAHKGLGDAWTTCLASDDQLTQVARWFVSQDHRQLPQPAGTLLWWRPLTSLTDASPAGRRSA